MARLATATMLLLACGATVAATVTEPSTFTILHRFTNAEGGEPRGRLLPAPDGSFYGTTDVQALRITTSGQVTLLYALNVSDGFDSRSLTLGKDGGLYGIRYTPRNEVFRLSAQGKMSTLHVFDNPTFGNSHATALVQGSDDAFYGVLSLQNVPGGMGALFRVAPDGAFALIHATPLPDHQCCGDYALAVGADGGFYGVSERGGAESLGNLFKVTAAGEVTVLHRFSRTDGWMPRAPLIRGHDGNFYGSTMNGGQGVGREGCGTIFRLTPSGALTVLHTFTGGDGCGPETPLVEAPDGTFYGATNHGGKDDHGVLFKMTAGGHVTVLHLLDYYRGRNQDVEVTLGPDGNLYGTSSVAPSTDGTDGVFFRLIPASVSRMVLTNGTGTAASIKAGVLTFREASSGKQLSVYVVRPTFVAARMAGSGIGSTGPWVWLSDDGRDAAMIDLDASANVTIQVLPSEAARRLVGKP